MKLGGAEPAFYRDRGGREEAAPVELGREWGGNEIVACLVQIASFNALEADC
jgi:hypothetical protein